jgi:hypothetical protein
MKLLLSFLLLASYSITAQSAQSICFTYDAAGNRTTRVSCIEQGLLINNDQQLIQPELIQLEPGQVILFPNPSQGAFQLRSDTYPAKTEIVVYNANAREISRRELGDGYFDLSAQPSGMYFLQLSHTGIRPQTVKVEIVKD